MQLGQHGCGEQASERCLRRIPPPDDAHLDVDVLAQAQNWLKQVVIDSHVRIPRIERRSLGRSIQTHLSKIGTHQAGVFLLYEPMIILLIRARTHEGQAADSRPKANQMIILLIWARTHEGQAANSRPKANQMIKVTTIKRRLAAIRKAHRTARLMSATEDIAGEQTRRGIRRSYGEPPQGKAPAVTDIVHAMVETLPATTKGVRDHALLLVGFAGAFRRSELVGLDVSDVQFVAEGLVITLRRSKTDQDCEGLSRAYRSAQRRQPALSERCVPGSTKRRSLMARCFAR